MKVIFIYIVCKDKAEAKRIGSALVKERLAACVNIFPEMNSIYRWKGQLEEANESVLIAKTTKSKFSKLSARVKELHSYECPCIMEIEVGRGNQEYVNWLLENLK
jgi:periplasmic divalent cation tolerance protein